MLSEYGITDARRPVDVNRALRRAGLLNVYTQAGMEYLDPWTSRAFAVADHQIAHVYVRDPADVPAARDALAGLPGVDVVLEGDERRDAGLGHERAGELVLVAEPDAWFTYYYWLDDERAPDFARQVEIHRKPGYDPAELFFDPDGPAGQGTRGRGAGAQEARLPLRDDGRPARPVGGPGHARAAAGRYRRTRPVLLCSDASRRARPDRRDRRARPAARAVWGVGGRGLRLVECRPRRSRLR